MLPVTCETRTVHVTYPFQTDGCARAGQLTMGNLLRANSSLGLYVKKEDRRCRGTCIDVLLNHFEQS